MAYIQWLKVIVAYNDFKYFIMGEMSCNYVFIRSVIKSLGPNQIKPQQINILEYSTCNLPLVKLNCPCLRAVGTNIPNQCKGSTRGLSSSVSSFLSSSPPGIFSSNLIFSTVGLGLSSPSSAWSPFPFLLLTAR